MDQLSLYSLGRNIQSLRLAKGYSLSQLALESGIAKSNLSMLEQGKGNPTIDTLWRIAKPLNIAFADLVKRMNDPVEDNGVIVRLIDHGNDDPKVDVYSISLAPHTLRKSEPHTAGSKEIVTVVSGEIEVGVENQTQMLSCGQTHKFASDDVHIYKTFQQWATMTVTVIYPNLKGDTGND